ncbi:F-box domain-containing protein [Heracleum sosnowskyi]|uniref:F-box domain-containing protein n=1 Tax=Heracleum sosnowskyi TaxID=360622 RepID=A0AAD8IQT2_9APIA|nr:F-box domain-containing protein [Heracleum sosnowskyi]
MCEHVQLAGRVDSPEGRTYKFGKLTSETWNSQENIGLNDLAVWYSYMDTSTDRKKNSEPGEDHAQRKGIESLPIEISYKLLAGLPVSSLVQCRYVSRTLRQLSHEASLLNIHLTRIGKKNPNLLFHCLDSAVNQLHFVELSDPLCDNETMCEINIPFCALMPDKIHIVDSCNGLLCISDEFCCDPYYIYNPFTKKYKELSKSEQFHNQKVEVGFGLDPVGNEYKLIKIVYYDDPYTGPLPQKVYTCGFPSYPHSEVQICDIVSNTWRSIGSMPWHCKRHTRGHFESPQDIFCLNGRLYWLMGSEAQHGFIDVNCIPRIISFNLLNEQFDEVLKPACGSLNKHNYLLLVLGGCLSAAVYSNDGKVEVWIMKEYNVKESWIKEFVIEAHPRNIDAGLLRSPNFKVFYVHGIWASRVLHGYSVRVLCYLKNGDILLEYKDRKLASYDPKNGEITYLQIQGLPTKFNTVVHVGGLNWINQQQNTSGLVL